MFKRFRKEPSLVMDIDRVPNQLPAIIGILSALSFPLFIAIWGIEPFTISIYIEVIILFCVLFLLLLWVGNWAERKWPEIVRDFCVAYLVVIFLGLFILFVWAITVKLSIAGYLFALSMLHLVLFMLLAFGRRAVNSALFGTIHRYIFGLLPLGFSVVLWLWLYMTYYASQPGHIGLSMVVVLLSLLVILICSWALDIKENQLGFRFRLVLYLLAGLLLIGLVYRPELFVDRHHYNFFLAPLNDVLHGKILFVNTTSQYRIGVIYFLALVFRVFHLPNGYYSLSFVVALLFIGQYLLLAFMLLRTTGRLSVSLLGILAIIYFNYLSVVWPSMLRTPAQSPLRYGLPYLMLCSALINLNSSNRYLQAFEYILVGIAATWSLETFLYSILSMDTFYFVKEILFEPRLKAGIRNFSKRIALQIGIIALSWGILLIFSWVISGQIPDFRMYFDYFQVYNQKPYTGGEVAVQNFRTGAVLFVYLISIFIVLFDRIRRKSFLTLSMASMLVGMSVAGILQYPYYFIYNLDFHLALLCVPLIFVLTLWFSIIQHHISIPRLFRVNMVASLLISFLALTFMPSSNFLGIFSNSLLYDTLRGVVKGHGIAFTSPTWADASNNSVAALEFLIQKYAMNEQQVAVFAPNEDETEALVLTNKTNILDISDPQMSAISPTYSQFVQQRSEALAGQLELIFYDKRADDLIPLQQDAFQTLTASASHVVIDKDNNYLVLEKVK